MSNLSNLLKISFLEKKNNFAAWMCVILFSTITATHAFTQGFEKTYNIEASSTPDHEVVVNPDGYVIKGAARYENDRIQYRDVKTDLNGNAQLNINYNVHNVDPNFTQLLRSGPVDVLVLSETSGSDVSLKKYGTSNDLLWERVYDFDDAWSQIMGKVGEDGPSGIKFIAGGVQKTFDPDPFPFDFDLYVIKLDASGNELWRQFYDPQPYIPDFHLDMQVEQVIPSSDGGVFVYVFIGNGNYKMLKIASDGNLVYDELLQNTSTLTLYDEFFPATDGGLVGTYTVGSASGPSRNIEVSYKINSDGSSAWNNNDSEYLGDFGIDPVGGRVEFQAGNAAQFILTGLFSENIATTPLRFFVTKMAPNGDKIWTKDYPINVECRDIKRTTDGGYIFTGLKEGKIWLMKTDSDGNVNIPTGDADLELSITANNTSPPLWSDVNFTVTLENKGPMTAQDIFVNIDGCSVSPPATFSLFFQNFGYVYANTNTPVSHGTYDQLNQNWNIPSLDAGESATLSFTLFSLTEEERIIAAEIMDAVPDDPDSTPGNMSACDNTEDDEATVSLNGSGTPCQITATASNVQCDDNGTPTDPADDLFSFSVVVNSTGDCASGFDGNAGSGNYGVTYPNMGGFHPINGGPVTLNFFDLSDPSATTSVTVDPPSPCSTGNGDPVLTITNVDCPTDFPKPTVVITWDIEIQNTGTGSSTDTTIYLYSIGSQEVGVTTTELGTATVPALSPGQSALVSITVPPSVHSPIPGFAGTGDKFILTGGKGLAFVPPISGNPPSYTEGNGFPNIYCKKFSTDISADLSTALSSVSPTEPLVYTIEVTNNGPVDAHNVISDLYSNATAIPSPIGSVQLSKGMEWELGQPAGAGVFITNYFWHIPFLAVGESATATVTLTPAPGFFEWPSSGVTISKTIDSGHNNDLNSSNNTDQITVPVTGDPDFIDLELSLSQPNADPSQWSSYEVIATIENKGDQAATGVKVHFPKPAGVVYVGGNEWTVSQGSFSGFGNEEWTVGNIAAGGSATLTVNYFLLNASAPEAYAQVTAANEQDSDSTPNNGTPPTVNEDDEASTGSGQGPDKPDLEIQGFGSTFVPGASQSSSPTCCLVTNFTVFNYTNVTMPGSQDALYLSTDPVFSSDDILIETYGRGDIAPGQGNVVGEIFTDLTNVQPGDYYVILFIDHLNAVDEANETNNMDVAAVTVPNQSTGADLQLSMETDASMTWPLDARMFVMATLENTGSEAATGVKVAFSDLLGAEVFFDPSTHIPSQGTFDIASQIWDVGTVSAGGQATLVIRLANNSEDTYRYFAQVSEMNEMDTDSSPGNATCCDPAEDDEAVVPPGPCNIQAEILQILECIPAAEPPTDQLVYEVQVSGTLGGFHGYFGEPGPIYSFPSDIIFERTVPRYETRPDVIIDNADPKCQTILSFPKPSCDNSTIDLRLDFHFPVSPLPPIYNDYPLELRVHNTGGIPATGVVIHFPKPDGTVYVGGNEWSASQGTFVPFAQEEWTVGTIPAGESATLTVNYFLLTGNGIMPYAQVVAANETDSDSTPNNGTCCTANEDDEIAANLTNGGGGSPLQIRDDRQRITFNRIYPNPCKYWVSLEIYSKEDQPVLLDFYNQQGQLVHRKEIILENGRNEIKLDVSQWRSGTYNVIGRGNGHPAYGRFLKVWED